MNCQFMRGYIPLFFIVIYIFSIKQINAQAIRLSWNLNPENDIKYYGIYKDTTSSPQMEISKVAASNITYLDYDIVLGKEYYYRITAVDSADNVSEFSDEVRIVASNPKDIILTNGGIPERFELSQNYPNPFNLKTTIKYAIANEGKVSLVILDLLGREVRELIDEYKNVGYYDVKWDGKDNLGKDVSTGIYFCRLIHENFYWTNKLTLQK